MTESASTAEQLLNNWLTRQCSVDACNWLSDQSQKIAEGNNQAFFLSFGMAGRKVGKHDLALNDQDLAHAEQARPGWNPQQWTLDQSARALLVLALPHESAEVFTETLDKVFAAADVGELVALYQMLPILPFQDAHIRRAAEGIRTNIRTVFCAVAHCNPYPKEQLDEVAWNQMVLKALFVDTILDPIVGIDERANEKLMTMLVDYAHERWSAHRTVSPELWRCVGPFADERALNDLERVMETGTTWEKQGATLALLSCPKPEAQNILAKHNELAESAKSNYFNWSTISNALANQ